jgi:hypothetical protein
MSGSTWLLLFGSIGFRRHRSISTAMHGSRPTPRKPRTPLIRLFRLRHGIFPRFDAPGGHRVRGAFTAWRASSESPGIDIELKWRGGIVMHGPSPFTADQRSAVKHLQRISSSAVPLRPVFTPLTAMS